MLIKNLISASNLIYENCVNLFQEEQLEAYMDGYDIVLFDDQTMNIPVAIVDSIINGHI